MTGMDGMFVSWTVVSIFVTNASGTLEVIAQNAISGQACGFEANFHTVLSEAVGEK